MYPCKLWQRGRHRRFISEGIRERAWRQVKFPYPLMRRLNPDDLSLYRPNPLRLFPNWRLLLLQLNVKNRSEATFHDWRFSMEGDSHGMGGPRVREFCREKARAIWEKMSGIREGISSL